MTNAAGGLTWKMITDERWSKYTWDELRAQLVQRFTQPRGTCFVLGSAVGDGAAACGGRGLLRDLSPEQWGA